MFCSNCGKEIDNSAKFCQFCGNELCLENKEKPKEIKTEEQILYTVEKHWVALIPTYFFGTCFLLTLFVPAKNMEANLIWLFVFAILALPALLSFIFDKIEITNKSFNMRLGVLNIDRTNIPLKKINVYNIQQSIFGRILNYGNFVFQSAASTGTTAYKYVKNPQELVEIMNNIME